jgi:hypothetical protein
VVDLFQGVLKRYSFSNYVFAMEELTKRQIQTFSDANDFMRRVLNLPVGQELSFRNIMTREVISFILYIVSK